jgi:hypothetical protein
MLLIPTNLNHTIKNEQLRSIGPLTQIRFTGRPRRAEGQVPFYFLSYYFRGKHAFQIKLKQFGSQICTG